MNRFAKQLLPFCSLIFIFSLWTFLVPNEFLTATNLTNVLSRTSVNLIMAAGMTFVIITAGIDLSVGTMMGMCGMTGALAMLLFSGASLADVASGASIDLTNGAMFGGILVSIAVGAIVGGINGTLITRLKLAPFIVTLGAMSIFRGSSLLMNSGKPFAVSDFTLLDTGRVAGIPVSVLLLALVLAITGFVLKYTRFGRYTYAIGSNVETAFHAGVNVNRVLVVIYALTGALVGLAAMITTSRASSAQPTAGLALELDIIAAVIIGGCSPGGGRGSMVGTVIGTLLIGFLRNGLTLCGISTNWQLVAIGLIIILAVTADQIATRRNV
ncbi:MAG: ABC transporter permease [Kiritimatiellia bacterium]|jgi:ribose/xylose/arabinose/galactoside ABC-type transport system permease subunit|nr:ABC transporter permease [Kiritimatiellia bacterium]MDP6630062.1 ABC transporter permease [Kiritimatiellia bacterium]MDP6811403.1 ABC transporter permease [Kiritimatiellia bacterium]MDP7023801.1 ABC transporter permease [Kiritimatiellia bacterium]